MSGAAHPVSRLAPGLRPVVSTLACLGLTLAVAQAQPIAQSSPAPTPAPVPAPAPTPAPDPAPEVQRIEVRGSGELSDTEQRRRDPVAKTIFGREELDKYGDISVSDVLKRLPGINMQGGNPRLRGLGAGYTLVLINGEPAPPGFSLENLSPSQVERIEVTKGPTAEHSAQAVAGTINIILRAAPRQRQVELRVGAGYQRERPVFNSNLTLGDRFGDFGLSLPLSTYAWRGGNETFVDRLQRDTALAPQHLLLDSRSRWWGGGTNLGPRIQWKPDDTWTLESQTFAQRHDFHSDTRTDIQVLAGLPPPAVHEVSTNGGYWQMLRTGLSVQRKGAQGERLEAKVGAQASGSEYRTDLDGSDANRVRSLVRVATGDSREQVRTTSGKFLQPWREAHTFAAGWDFEWKRRTETRTIIENGLPQLVGFEGEPFRAEVSRGAFWAQDEWEIAPQWSTYLGLRGERIVTTSRSSADELTHTSQVVTPLWHLNYKLDPKGRDLVRASLTRSYRAPDLNRLMARPTLNAAYPVDKPNPEIAPDRTGNPALRPELSTGLDLALERYIGSGVVSVAVFHRRIEGVVRNVTALQAVPWASVPRWVSRPVNLDLARSSGVELELKGKVSELLPAAGLPAGLSVRASAAWYRSSVSGIPGPANRLEGQQPWQATAGFDHLMAGSPLGFGGNLAITPAYDVQLSTAQLQQLGRARSLDLYATWTWSRQAVLRVAANNVSPLPSLSRTSLVDADGVPQGSNNRTRNRTSYNVNLTLKF